VHEIPLKTVEKGEILEIFNLGGFRLHSDFRGSRVPSCRKHSDGLEELETTDRDDAAAAPRRSFGLATIVLYSVLQEGRASRQTELQREFPLHVVCSWLGNSPRIAQQSYLLVTQDDFAKAAGVAKVMVEGLVPCVVSSKHHHRQGH